MKENRFYLLLTFFLTFLFWGILVFYTQSSSKPFNTSFVMIIFYVLGVVSPAIAGVIVKKRALSKSAFKAFLKNIVFPSKKWLWYIVLVAVVLCFKMIPFLAFGGEKITFIYMVLLQLPLYVLIGGLEEIGWRGLLFANLQKKMSAFKSTLITGVIWIIWHLPLFFIIGTYQEMYSNYYTFALNTLGFSFILSAAFMFTKSIFMCIFSHAFLNSLAGVFVTHETIWSSMMTLLLGVALFFGFVIYQRRSTSGEPVDKGNVPQAT